MPHPEPCRPTEPTNLILYGPPGTGKTFATVERAVRLCDGDAPNERGEVEARFRELLAAHRIEFVTFHQTYGYEDFVEGLRPPTGRTQGKLDEGSPTEAGFRLDPTDGVFKRIANAARRSSEERAFDVLRPDAAPPRVWKMALGEAGREEHIYQECIEKGQIALGWGDPADWSDPAFEDYAAIDGEWLAKTGEHGTESRKLMLHNLRNEMKEGDLIVVSKGVARFRAIMQITGPYEYVEAVKEYRQRRPARLLWMDESGAGVDVATIRSGGSTFGRDSITKLHDVTAQKLRDFVAGPPDHHVLVIDEINRANVSKVFGELITLLESDKRSGAVHELSVTLPFSGERFSVPPNLHLIGTMNTADRSVALLDTALRRRFEFEEVMPDPSLLSPVDGIDLAEVLRTINERVEYLFDRDHTIGHAYFRKCGSRDELDRIMRGKVIPLLVEYFHEDWDKVRAVLGESGEGGGFIVRRRLEPPPGQEAMGERFTYAVRDAFAPDAYDRLLGRAPASSALAAE